VISRLPNGTYTENGISAGTYQYVYKAFGVRNVNGDESYETRFTHDHGFSQAAPLTPLMCGVCFRELAEVSRQGHAVQRYCHVPEHGNTTWRAGEGYRLAKPNAMFPVLRDWVLPTSPFPTTWPVATVTFTFNGAAANGEWTEHPPMADEPQWCSLR
jgi:hypothetical protein